MTEDESNSGNKVKKLVSVIIVSRNAINTIKQCLDNVLNQTYPRIEVVVVDSSDDGTKEVLKEYQKRSKFPFKIINQEPRGVGAARNTGLDNAKGEIIAGVDVDVFIPKDYIEKIAEPFNKSDKVMGVYVKHNLKPSINSLFSKLIVLWEDIMFPDTPYRDGTIGVGALKKEFWERVGGIDTDLPVGEDAVYLKRINRVKKELEEQGYLFPLVNTATTEVKQGLSFKEYWKKCMWYGKVLAHFKYLRSDLKNVFRLLGSTYLFILPFAAIPAFAIWWEFGILLLIPLFAIIAYTIFQAFRKRIFSWMVLLLPIVLYYKGFWSFLGLAREYFKGRLA